VLQLLDGLEDQRSLSNLESAFRKLVKSHLSNLLEAKRKYWKQRNTIRWITLGDENTSFFQAMPTHRHSKKYIGSLAVHDDIPITDHEQKARILWNAFKDRLGINYFQGISYDLEDLLQSHDLSSLVEAFSQVEINDMIKDLPNYHAPRPDGLMVSLLKSAGTLLDKISLGFSMTSRVLVLT
jgi:hypothetical protein